MGTGKGIEWAANGRERESWVESRCQAQQPAPISGSLGAQPCGRYWGERAGVPSRVTRTLVCWDYPGFTLNVLAPWKSLRPRQTGFPVLLGRHDGQSDGLFPLKGPPTQGIGPSRATASAGERQGGHEPVFPVRDPGCKECGSSAEPPEERRPAPAFPCSLELASETHRQRQQPPRSAQ